MKTQNNFAKSFFDHADSLMIIVGCDEIIYDINQKGSEILGYSVDEIKGKNLFDFLVPQEKKEASRRFFHSMLQGSLRHVHSEYSITTKRGEPRVLNFHNILVADENGKTTGILSSAEDVTERREKEVASKDVERELKVSLDYMLEGCQIIDFDWRYFYVNDAAARQGRTRREQLLGNTMMQAYPGIEKTELFTHLRNCMNSRVPYKMDNEFVFPDGTRGWFELHIEPVPEGILILSMDITKNKETEAELKNYRSRLEQVVNQRTAECAQVNEELDHEIEAHRKADEGLKLRTLILDNARESIFLINTKGDFAYANKAATKMYGYNLDEFLNMNIRSLLKPEETPSIEPIISTTLEKGELLFETTHVRKDHCSMPVQVYFNYVKTSHGHLIVVISHNQLQDEKNPKGPC